MAYLDLLIQHSQEISITKNTRSTLRQLKEAASKVFGSKGLITHHNDGSTTRYFLVIPQSEMSPSQENAFNKEVSGL